MIGYTRLYPGKWGWMVTMLCDPYQSQSLALYGEWASAEQNILNTFIRPGDVIVDAGANVGTRTIPFGMLVGPEGKVYAVEPQRLCYLCLCANIALNSLGMFVYPLHAALGAEPGEIECPMPDPTKPNNTGGLRLKDHTENKEMKLLGREVVPKITIDNIGLERCALIKIDVEGMEADVLRGAAETVERFRPTIWAECLPHEEYTSQREDLKSVLQSFGYKARAVQTPVYIPNNPHLSTANPYGQQVDHNIVCMHKDSEMPEWASKLTEFC